MGRLLTKTLLQFHIFSLCVGLCSLLTGPFCPISRAQDGLELDGPAAASLPQDIPPLPGPGDAEAKLYVSRTNVAVFHDLLIAPLATWLKDGKFVLRVVREPEFDWTLSEDWEGNSRAAGSHYSLDRDWNLIGAEGPEAAAGLPFGRADLVNSESDSQRKAYKILWNIAAMEGVVGDLLYGGELCWFSSQSLQRKSAAMFYRRTFFRETAEQRSALLPKTEDELSFTRQSSSSAGKAASALSQGQASSAALPLWTLLRQDVLQLLSPPVVFGYSVITWRHPRAVEDEVWIHSPVIDRNRHVLSANRGDRLLDGVLSYDDLFVSGAKVQSVFARVVEEKVLLVPFPSLTPYQLEQERVLRTENPATSGGTAPRPEMSGRESPDRFEDIWTVRGRHTRPTEGPVMTLWNFEAQRGSPLAAWVPVTVYFIPRRVWIIEFSAKDPFYPAGRQVLVVDQDSMLPVYKIIYNQKGDYDRTIIGGWILARDKSGHLRFPAAAFVLGVDREARNATAFTADYVRTFLGKNTAAAREVRKLVDITEYRRQRSAKEPAKEVRETKEQAESAADRDFEASRAEEPEEREQESESSAEKSSAGGLPEEDIPAD